MYVDSNALVYLLHDVKPKSDMVSTYLARADQVYTSLRTVEEASYVLVRVEATRRYGVRGIYQVREVVKKHGLDFVKGELAALRSLLEEYGIIVLQDRVEVEELHDTMIRYKLLPGDAIIALTCKHYGIDTILTFDDDFRRVPWLRVVP